MRCPGSLKLHGEQPDTSSPAAAEGTFAHLVAAKCLDKLFSASRYRGVVSADGAFTVDDEMVENVQVYLDAVRAVATFTGGELHVEKRVAMAGVLAPSLWGTADALVFSPGVLDVFDFKYGAGVYVDEKANEQAMIYGAAAIVTFIQSHPGIKRVRLHIVQPRHHRGPAWRTWEITAADLCKWADEECLPAARLALDLGTSGVRARVEEHLVPGEKQCTFCNAANTCPARKAEMLTVAQDVFDAPVAGVAVEKTIDVPSLSVESIAQMLQIFPRVESYIKAVRERADELAHNGQDVPGFKLVDTLGDRKWKDEQAAAGFLATLGLDPVAPAKTVSVAAAVKVIMAGTKHNKKTADELVAPMVTRKAGKKLAPNDDTRPAAISAADVFSDC
tara:strand:+ start:4420 stop:5589 length:1170 start_codon:yes stop_codon:yes gene_type:complete